MNILVVYDYLGPNGYIPFNYKKDNISTILHNEQYRTTPRNYMSPDIPKILTKDISISSSDIKDNLYLILINDKLKNIELNEILSEKLLLLLENYPNNIKILYVNLTKDTMHTLL